MALVHSFAPRLRRSVLARFENALAPSRRRWVDRHGPHPDWVDDEGEEDAAAAATALDHVPDVEEPAPALEQVVPDQDQLERANHQIKRLLSGRKADKAEIRALKAQLAEAKEALRRSNLGIRAKHAGELSKPSTSTRS